MNVAFITGTTRGLGAAMQSAFEAAGWRVVGLNRPDFDLARPDLPALYATFRREAARRPERAVFVNNAATHTIREASALEPDQISAAATVNISSPIVAISAFLRCFPAGEVANVTSAAATTGVPHWGMYCAAKAAMDGFLRALAAEGIVTHSLDPGAIDTDMQAAIRGSDFPGAEAFAAMKLSNPQTVAKALVWRIDRSEMPAPARGEAS